MILVDSRRGTTILLFAVMAIAVSCGTVSPQELAFGQLFPFEDTNRSLTLTLFETRTTPAGASLFTLTLSNASRYLTTFPPGYGARGFIWRNDTSQWQEVKNEVEFQGLELALGPRGSDQTSLGFVEFSSPFSELATGTQLRVVVHGTQHEEDATARADVLAFIDIELAP